MNRPRLSTISAILLTLVVAGCVSGANIPTIAPLSRDIGPPPPDLQEVEVAPPRAGENVFAVADRERFGRKLANYRICKLRGEWVKVRTEFLAGAGDVPPAQECTSPEAATAEAVKGKRQRKRPGK